MRFENKSVIITGGGGKIGKAYALGFAKEGAKVALPDIASAEHVVKAIQDSGGAAISMACDAPWLAGWVMRDGLRCFEREQRQGHGRRSGEAIWQHRRPGQQCRLLYGREEESVLGNGSRRV